MKAWKTRVGSNLAAVLVVMTMTAAASPPRGYTLSGGTRQSNDSGQCGSSWSIVSSPNQGSDDSNYLQGVKAFSSNDAWAVGWSRAGGDNAISLHWDGSVWNAVPGPSPLGDGGFLYGIDGVSSTDFWSV